MPIRNLLHYLKKYDIILSWNAFHREFQKYKTADRFTIQISFVFMYGTGIISKKCIMIIIQRGDCYEITHFYRDRCAAPCRIVRNGGAESDSRYAEWSCILALRWRSAPWKRWSKQRFRSICMPGRAFLLPDGQADSADSEVWEFISARTSLTGWEYLYMSPVYILFFEIRVSSASYRKRTAP